MKAMSAKDTKYGFGCQIEMVHQEPVVVEKHGRPIVVVLAVEDYQPLIEASDWPPESRRKKLQGKK